MKSCPYCGNEINCGSATPLDGFVHLDENWFGITQEEKRLLVLEDSQDGRTITVHPDAVKGTCFTYVAAWKGMPDGEHDEYMEIPVSEATLLLDATTIHLEVLLDGSGMDLGGDTNAGRIHSEFTIRNGKFRLPFTYYTSVTCVNPRDIGAEVTMPHKRK